MKPILSGLAAFCATLTVCWLITHNGPLAAPTATRPAIVEAKPVPAPITKWTYLQTERSIDYRTDQSVWMNELGVAGWECVSVAAHPNGKLLIYVFKTPQRGADGLTRLP